MMTMFDVARPFIYAALIGVGLGLVLRIYKQSKAGRFWETFMVSMATIPVFYMALIFSALPILYFAVSKKQRIIKYLVKYAFEVRKKTPKEVTKEAFEKMMNDNWYRLCLNLFADVLSDIDTITYIMIDSIVMMIDSFPDHSMVPVFKVGVKYLTVKLSHLIVDPFITNKLVYKKA